MPSCLFHWVEVSVSGIVIHEVWADRAAWELALIDSLLPAAAILGRSAPTVTVRTIGGYLTDGA